MLPVLSSEWINSIIYSYCEPPNLGLLVTKAILFLSPYYSLIAIGGYTLAPSVGFIFHLAEFRLLSCPWAGNQIFPLTIWLLMSASKMRSFCLFLFRSDYHEYRFHCPHYRHDHNRDCIILLGVVIEERSFNAPSSLYSVVFGLLGALVGLVLTPYFTTRPARSLRALLGRIDASTLLAGLTGLIVGLLISALLAFPLSLLPSPFGEVLPFIGVVVFSYFGIAVFIMRQKDIFSVLRDRLPRRGSSQEHRKRQLANPDNSDGYECDYRWPHPGHRSHRVYEWRFGNSPICIE